MINQLLMSCQNINIMIFFLEIIFSNFFYNIFIHLLFVLFLMIFFSTSHFSFNNIYFLNVENERIFFHSLFVYTFKNLFVCLLNLFSINLCCRILLKISNNHIHDNLNYDHFQIKNTRKTEFLRKLQTKNEKKIFRLL